MLVPWRIIYASISENAALLYTICTSSKSSSASINFNKGTTPKNNIFPPRLDLFNAPGTKIPSLLLYDRPLASSNGNAQSPHARLEARATQHDKIPRG